MTASGDVEMHVSETLPAYVRGELSRPAAAAVRRHLRECSRCRQEADAVRAVWAAPAPALTRAERERVGDTLAAAGWPSGALPGGESHQGGSHQGDSRGGSFRGDGPARAGVRGRRAWGRMRVGWRVAATAILVLGGIAVWRWASVGPGVGGVRDGADGRGWSAATVVAAWREDLRETGARPAEVRLALGLTPADATAEDLLWEDEGEAGLGWRELSAEDVRRAVGPWEEE